MRIYASNNIYGDIYFLSWRISAWRSGGFECFCVQECL